jgi:hypothetical protein
MENFIKLDIYQDLILVKCIYLTNSINQFLSFYKKYNIKIKIKLIITNKKSKNNTIIYWFQAILINISTYLFTLCHTVWWNI